MLDDAVISGNKVRFDLTNMKNIEGVLNGSAYQVETTTAEIRHIIENWGNGFNKIVTFYEEENRVLKEYTDINKLLKWFKK